MIDFHTHIIPNIDDGSRSIEETCNLIKEAKEAGFDEIVLTSHYIEKYYETDVPERDIWVEVITENLKNRGINTKVYLGNEIYLTDNIMDLLINGKASTINNSSYVLVELPENELPDNKLIPIIAHPERCTKKQKKPDIALDLIDMGVLMQANYGSILGLYGKKTEFIVRKFFENNMIHFLGSDVHNQDSIYKLIPDALNEIEKIIGTVKLNELTTVNPQLAVNNKKIDVIEPNDFELSLKEKIKMFLP